jgi:DNA-binding NarL/FixJ family response regulator
MTKLVLIDDHEMLRGGMRAVFDAQPDMHVVGEAADGAAGVELVLSTHPDVALMDIRMPGVDGIEATRRIVAAGSRARILIVTTFDDDESLVDALRAGAAGFILKDASAATLTDAVRAVAEGDRMIDGTITRRLIEQHLERTGIQEQLSERFADLTKRETDLIRRLARGRSNAELADELSLSEATVKTHLTRSMAKLGTRSRVQAVVLAYESGLVRPGELDDHDFEALANG